jgi:uncharacterized damage-inducible protein DinB
MLAEKQYEISQFGTLGANNSTIKVLLCIKNAPHMATTQQPEVWQRGPVPGIAPLLQPVAHALLQAQEEIHGLLNNFSPAFFWQQPAGLASPAFHVQHITGVLDRLFTYAKGEALSPLQLHALSLEGKNDEAMGIDDVLAAFDSQIEKAIAQLGQIDVATILDLRGIGRKQIPTNVLGLLFHAAEHTMRHTGQLLVTTSMLTALNPNG